MIHERNGFATTGANRRTSVEIATLRLAMANRKGRPVGPGKVLLAGVCKLTKR